MSVCCSPQGQDPNSSEEQPPVAAHPSQDQEQQIGSSPLPQSIQQQQQQQPQHETQQQLGQQEANTDEYETVYETEEVTQEQYPVPYNQRFSIPGRRVQLTSSATPLATSTTGLPPSAESSVFGWVMSAAILAAIRLSRDAADAERMDLRALQARQAESRVQDAELRARRAAFLEAERQRKEAEAAQSMAQARQRAEQEAAKRAAEEAAYAAAQAKEAEEFRRRQEEARKVFFKSDLALAAELERRTQTERRLLEEAEAKRKAEEEAQRVAAAECAAAEAAEAAARAEAARLEQQAAEARQAEERRRLQALLTRYTLVLQGSVVAQTAPLNTFTTASTSAVTGVPPLPQPARLQLSLRVSVQAATQQQPLAAHPQPQAAAAADLAATAQDAQQAGSATSPHQRPEGVREAPLDSSGISVSTDSRSPASAASTSAGSSSPEVRSESAGDARAQALPLQPTPREEVFAFASVDAALEGSTDLAGSVAEPFLDDLWSQIKQDVRAEGRPALLMDDIELEHWKRLCVCVIEASCRRGASQVAPIVSGSEPLESQLQITLHRAALPRGHPARINSRLSAAVAFALDGQLDEAVGIVNTIIEEEQSMVEAGGRGPGATPNVALPPCTVHALTYAHLLDRALATVSPPTVGGSPAASAPRGSSSSSSPGPYGVDGHRVRKSSDGSSPDYGSLADTANETVSGTGSERSSRSIDDESSRSDGSGSSSAPSISPEDEEGVAQLERQQQQLQPLFNLARYQLQLAAKAAKPDQLTPTARSVALALGSESHPIADIMAQLAERNMSAYARQRMERRRQQQELETAAALLKRQEPQGRSVDPSSDPSRRNTPVPEQLWGLRNLANKIIFYDNALEIYEALGWLRDACDIAAEYYGAGHPSQLGPLLDYQAALQVAINTAGESDQQEELQEKLATRLVVSNKIVELVQLVGERYINQKDYLSAVLLFEATLKGLGRLLPEDHPGMVNLKQQTKELLLTAISPAEARVVSRKRSDTKTALQSLAQGFTADLGVYALRKPGTSFPEQWKKGLKLPPLR